MPLSSTPFKKSILNLDKHIDSGIRVKMVGGREVEGILKGYDESVNLVLLEGKEYLRSPEDPSITTEETRDLGLVVCRGTQVALICPVDGTNEIANPFTEEDDESI